MTNLRDELQQALERMYEQACRVETYVELLREDTRSLQRAVQGAQISLADNLTPTADDSLEEDASELEAMTHDINRLADAITRMRGDCERV